MKRALCILLVLAMLPSLCACGSIYSNYREMEQLLVLQTMGLDTADGGVRLSLASAANTEKGSSPIRLEVEGVNISSAFPAAIAASSSAKRDSRIAPPISWLGSV